MAKSVLVYPPSKNSNVKHLDLPFSSATRLLLFEINEVTKMALKHISYPPETKPASLHLKMDGWKTIVSF